MLLTTFLQFIIEAERETLVKRKFELNEYRKFVRNLAENDINKTFFVLALLYSLQGEFEMKKYLLVLCAVAILMTGCSNSNVKKTDSADEVKSLVKELAVASANNDNDKMVELSNEILKKNAIPQGIQVGNGCHEVTYLYNGQRESLKYCK